jgi:hypothetical protein
MNAHARNTDLALLHPAFRKAVKALQNALDQEKIPLRPAIGGD